MGAWGLLFDENDDAADWLGDFGESPSWASVTEALAITDVDYVEAPEACSALAAAEIVAASLGKPSLRLEGSSIEWAATQPEEGAARREQAIAALIRVRDDSELNELWEDTGEYAQWQASVNETLARLGKEAS